MVTAGFVLHTERDRAAAITLDLANWLLGRGYTEPAALKLVGDRFQLHQRQLDIERREIEEMTTLIADLEAQ